MKKCPNCGSVLSDFEPYCDFCGFDPDYDMGSWDYGEPASSRRPYYHGEHIKEPSPYVLGKETDWAFCIIAWSITVGLIIICTWDNIISAIWYNMWLITILIFIGVSIFVIYEINKKVHSIKQDKIKREEQQKDLEVKKHKRKHKILTYNPNTSKYRVCMECGYENPKNLSKCWDCGADLTNQEPMYAKKHIESESKTVNNPTNSQINSSKKKLEHSKEIPHKRLKSKSKYERCPKCNSLVNMNDGSVCRYCNYDILSENFQYCPFCAKKIPSNAKVCYNCKRHIK